LSSGGSENNSPPDGFKKWVNPAEKTTHVISYDYHFYTAHYGEVYDYIDVNLEALNMMFLIKRYARTNSDKTLLSISDEKSHNSVKNKILFTDNDDFNDRVTFYCYKKIDPSTTGNSNQLRALNSSASSGNVKATLTYEFFPNIVYNINFKPKCSKFIEIDHLKPVDVYINGGLLNPGDAPEDFDEEIIEQKHLVREGTNSLELKFRMPERRKGKVYLKNFKFTSKNMLNDAPKSVHREGNGAYDPNLNGTDPQN
jgi:hypothetical protein